MKLSTITLFLSLLVSSSAIAQDKKPKDNSKERSSQNAEEGNKTSSKKDSKSGSKASKKIEKTTKASVTIDGKKIDYTVTASELMLTADNGTPRAKIFNISYIAKTDVEISKRPVLFAFNGGPGSSAVWLHLGALGPRIVPGSEDGTAPIKPPTTLIENAYSILDVADLVFIDPVSTGYSRQEKGTNKGEFHGVNGDIDSVADFIRRWVSENKRWSSPKFLLGESYGGIRAAGLSSKLQKTYGMHMNGVVLLSSLLDYRTLIPSRGNDLSYALFLPTMNSVAHHHGVLKGDRNKLYTEAKKFADTEYLTALHKGRNLSVDEKQRIAEKLSGFTGIDTNLILKSNLRISPSFFRKTLLQDQNKIMGRFDARVAWPAVDNLNNYAEFDPSFNVAKGPFTNAMMAYLTDDLNWDDKRVYEIITGKVHPWKWDSNNRYVNLSSSLEGALTENPHLKVLIQCGYTDLATPSGGILHSVDHLNITPEQRKNIDVTWYDAGHMFYLNQPDLVKMRDDLVKFITE